MPGTKKSSYSKKTFKNRKTKKSKGKKKMSRSSKKSVKGSNNSKYQDVEEWITKNWPHESLSIPKVLISNLAGAAIDRKSSLDDFKNQLLQNLKKSKTKNEKDEKKIIKFFKTLKTKF